MFQVLLQWMQTLPRSGHDIIFALSIVPTIVLTGIFMISSFRLEMFLCDRSGLPSITAVAWSIANAVLASLSIACILISLVCGPAHFTLCAYNYWAGSMSGIPRAAIAGLWIGPLIGYFGLTLLARVYRVHRETDEH